MNEGYLTMVWVKCVESSGGRYFPPVVQGNYRKFMEILSRSSSRGEALGVAFSPTGQELAVIDNQDHLRLYKVGTWEELGDWKFPRGVGYLAPPMRYLSGGKQLVVGCRGAVYRLSLRPLKLLEEMQPAVLGEKERVVGLASDAGEKYLVVASKRWVLVYDMGSRRLLYQKEYSEGDVTAVALSPDGRLLAISHGQEAGLPERVWGPVQFQGYESEAGVDRPAERPPERSWGYAELCEARSGQLLCRLEW
jgi:WD40 repeat protein